MRGLLAIEPLYHQIKVGNKTQTRRSGGLDQVNESPDNWEITGSIGGENELHEVDFCDYMDTQRNIHCKPRYKVAEILYLKEPVGVNKNDCALDYMYDYTPESSVRIKCSSAYKDRQWSNKLFMPASLARVFVKITSVRCERLMDISDEDCISEGLESIITKPDGEIGYKIYGIKSDSYTLSPKDSFISLYKHANKVKQVPNLWVWVYEFEYLKNFKP